MEQSNGVLPTGTLDFRFEIRYIRLPSLDPNVSSRRRWSTPCSNASSCSDAYKKSILAAPKRRWRFLNASQRPRAVPTIASG